MKAPSSDAPSSDDDEDLAALAACAVSFEEISQQQQQIAAQAKQRLSRKRDRQHVASAVDGDRTDCAAEGDKDGRGGSWRDAYCGEPNNVLDAAQRKIAAALDALLEQRIADKKVKKVKRPEPANGADVQPAHGPAADDPGQGQGSDSGGFRFFRRVPRGAVVVLERPNDPGLMPAGEGTPFPALFRARHQPRPDAVKAALPALAVDGGQLLQQLLQAPVQQQVKPKHGVRLPGSGKLPCSGTVLEGRPFVPHEERMRKLLAPGPVT